MFVSLRHWNNVTNSGIVGNVSTVMAMLKNIFHCVIVLNVCIAKTLEQCYQLWYCGKCVYCYGNVEEYFSLCHCVECLYH